MANGYKGQVTLLKADIDRRFVGDTAFDVLDQLARAHLERCFNHLAAIAYECPDKRVALQALQLQLHYFLGQPIARSEVTTRDLRKPAPHVLERFSPEALAAVRKIKDEVARLNAEVADEVDGYPLPPLPPRVK